MKQIGLMLVLISLIAIVALGIIVNSFDDNDNYIPAICATFFFLLAVAGVIMCNI